MLFYAGLNHSKLILNGNRFWIHRQFLVHYDLGDLDINEILIFLQLFADSFDNRQVKVGVLGGRLLVLFHRCYLRHLTYRLSQDRLHNFQRGTSIVTSLKYLGVVMLLVI